MKVSPHGLLVALLALLISGCAAASADTRPLTDAERQALIREQQTAALRKDVGVDGNARPGCTHSSPGSRTAAQIHDHQGADAFDSQGCPPALPPGGGAPAGGPVEPSSPKTGP